MKKNNVFKLIPLIVAILSAILVTVISFFNLGSDIKLAERILTLVFKFVITFGFVFCISLFMQKKSDKYSVFKTLLVAILFAMLFSFLISQSSMGYTGIEKGLINSITFIDLVSNGLTSFSVFIATFIYILAVGILYAVMKKTGKYDAIINNTAVKFKNKKSLFLIVSILTLGILTAVMGDIIPVLVFIPAFIDIAKKLGYDSKKSILATVGATLLGNAASLYTNYTNQILAVTVSDNIIVKIIILVISLTTLILFSIFTSKPENVKLEKEEVKKSLPIAIAFDIVIVLLILGMVPWATYFEFEGFNDFHNLLLGIEICGVSIFQIILGTTLSAFGTWTVYSLVVLVLIISLVLSLIYRIKFDELLETVAKGIKASLPYALILVIANIVLVGVYNSGFFITVMSSIGSMKDSILSSTTVSALSALVYPDYTYASQFTLSTLATVVSNNAIYATLAIIFQTIYSLILLISPTSVLVLMALHYEGVSYKDWLKYIYKLFLGILIVFFAIIIIIGRHFIRPISIIVLVILILIFALLIILSLLGDISKDESKEKEDKKVEKKESPKHEVKKTTNKKKNTKKK